MAKTPKSITVNREALDSIHRKLEKFMENLPAAERQALTVILARAASAQGELSEDIDRYLVAGHREGGAPTLPLVARAIDGRSTVEGPPWAYVIWTYNSK